MVIGVASATDDVWLLSTWFYGRWKIFLWPAESTYLFLTQRIQKKLLLPGERELLEKLDIASSALCRLCLKNGECETSAQLMTNRAFPRSARLCAEKNRRESNPACRRSVCEPFAVGALFPMITITLLPFIYSYSVIRSDCGLTLWEHQAIPALDWVKHHAQIHREPSWSVF